MGKPISIGQSHNLMSILANNAGWDELEGEVVQAIIKNPREAGRQFTRFLMNGARLISSSLKVATVLFDPAEFISPGWSILPDEQDKRSAALAKVDFGEVDFLTCLREGESSIKGEIKFARLRALGCPLLGANVFAGLWQDYCCHEKGESVLEGLRRERGVIRIDFFGDILRHSTGNRYVLVLSCDVAGLWKWDCRWLDETWSRHFSSAVLPQEA